MSSVCWESKVDVCDERAGNVCYEDHGNDAGEEDFEISVEFERTIT